jgi:fatty acid synthase subunit beta
MAELMFVDGEWVHSTYKDRFVLFAQRTEERFASGSSVYLSTEADKLSLIASNPVAFLKSFEKRYPNAVTQILATQDVDYFIWMCRERGKPVNFVPVIDKDLSFWFKKDSLWQSENLRFVQDRDVGRVVILHGPVAARYSTKANEPIGDILNNLNKDIIEELKKTCAIYPIEYLGGATSADALRRDFKNVTIQQTDATQDGRTNQITDITITSAKDVQHSAWISFLAGTTNCWWRALLTASQIAHGQHRIANKIPSLLTARDGQRIQLISRNNVPVQVKVFDKSGNMAADFQFKDTDRSISVTVFHALPPAYQLIPMKLSYTFKPDQGL